MKRRLKVRHEFVEFVPKDREEGVLYVSIPYATAVHNCFCGCGIKVVTPISPVGWQLTFDGETVSLWPSVGNWSFPCRSHYFIRHDAVEWAGDMSDEAIARGRGKDQAARRQHFDGIPAQHKARTAQVGTPPTQDTQPKKRKKAGFWSWLLGREGAR